MNFQQHLTNFSSAGLVVTMMIDLQHQLSTLSSAEPGSDNVEKIAVSLLNFNSAEPGSDNVTKLHQNLTKLCPTFSLSWRRPMIFLTGYWCSCLSQKMNSQTNGMMDLALNLT